MHVLVIDDEPAVRQILMSAVRKAGYSVEGAENCAEAQAKLARGDVDLALCDIKMPDGNGVDLVRAYKAGGGDAQFIMVTAFASVETAVEALRAGATDYIVKPVRNEELLHRLEQIDAMRGLKAENRALKTMVAGNRDGMYRCTSPAMVEVDRLVSKVAGTDSTVLITGESGSGKGMLARRLHEQSQRASFPFLPVNCGAIPEHLLESEFFGHTKGAFTGADRLRKGLFLQADRGTLFLDEIGELPLHMQTKLLHVIEDKEVRPLGSEQARRVDTRIIAATNRDLHKMVEEGKFREDLYFRLSMFHIHIPPLRERREDIAGLIDHLLAGLASGGRALELDPEAREVLLEYTWPGNVRQLENAINRAHILADGGRITLADLPPEITKPQATASATGTQIASGGGLRERLRQVEAELIAQALQEANGDRRTAAQKLGIGLSSLYRKIEELSGFGLMGEGTSGAKP
ncbi:MAG: sigma-54-dependent transcriptional regulator [Pseudomonadota bacterium]